MIPNVLFSFTNSLVRYTFNCRNVNLDVDSCFSKFGHKILEFGVIADFNWKISSKSLKK